MYQPISFIGLVNGLHHLSFASQVMSHDLTSVDSISFCPACKWGLLSTSTSFYTNAQYVMWTYWFNIDDVLSLNVVTMVFSWLTFAIWCLCFGLLSTSERPVHWIYVWKGGGWGREVVNDVLFTYTTYSITKKVFFHLLWWKIHFLSFVSNIALGLLEFLYRTYNINVLILSFGPNIWGGAVTTSFL